MTAASILSDKLLSTLTKLGCDLGQKLQANSLEWMFEEESTLPFLTWLANSLDAANLLSPEEKDRFEIMVKGKGRVLREEDLDIALQAVNENSFETDVEESEELLRADLQMLRQEIAKAKAYKDKIILHRNALNVQQQSLSRKLNYVQELGKASKKKSENLIQESEESNKKVNASMAAVSDKAITLTQLHSLDSGSFLYQLPLSDYYSSTERFLHSLTDFIKKQFSEGISDLVGPESESYYQLIDIRNPLEELLRGKSKEEFAQECQELSRLQQIYPLSKLQQIKAKAKLHGLQSACEFANAQLQSQQPLYSGSIHTLKQLVKEKRALLQRIRDDIMTIPAKSLNSVLKKAAQLQDTRVLRGDYDLKLARQNYFTSKQNEVIRKLVFLKSCEQFISMALEIEAKKLRDSHRLLLSIQTMIAEDCRAINDRINVLTDWNGLTIKSPRNTVDSRDLLLTRIYNVLDPSDASQKDSNLFITYSSLIEAMDSLKRHVTSLNIALTKSDSQSEEKLRENLSKSSNLKGIIFHGNYATSSLHLSPKAILDHLTELEETLTFLEKSIKDIIVDFDRKKKILQTDQFKSFERHMFVLLYTNPDQLQKHLQSLKERVLAQKVT